MSRKSKIYNFSNEEFKKIIEQSNSLTDCCIRLNFSPYGTNGRNQIKKRAEELGIPLKFSYENKREYKKQSYDEILVENSSYQSRQSLKKRLLRDNLLENKCQICGQLPIWNNQPLSLQLDHINGHNNDNRLENLRILCPNCHSQTNTFSGKNKK